jgi:SAM-dependent methyltransferase
MRFGMSWLRQLWATREVRGREADAPQTVAARAAVIRSKPLLRAFYEEAYRFFEASLRDAPGGTVLELGSGPGFIKEVLPHVVTSDIMDLPGADKRVSAMHLPFADDSLAAVLLLNTFHHIPDAGAFLDEAARTLKPGGKVVMIEPANTVWGGFVYRHFRHEEFNTRQQDWTFPPGGPMSTANGALAWIVFVRDAALFRERFPGLTIEAIDCRHPLLYLLSGGTSMRGLAPGRSLPLIRGLERLLAPLSPWLGTYMSVVLRKTGSASAVG